MNSRPKVLDLFAGCGGMSLGLEAAGFDIAASVEFDAIHSLVHHFNFPYSATICANVKDVTKDIINAEIKKKGFSAGIDVIVGGPPCQGFSHIGKRILDDPRNELVFEYLRLVKEIKPKFFIFENVPGIATGSHKQLLDELITEIEKIGYNVTLPYRILNSADFGTAQSRKRLILLGRKKKTKNIEYPKETHSGHVNNIGLFENLLPYVTTKDVLEDLERIQPFIGEDLGIDVLNKKYLGEILDFSFDPSGNFSLCHKRAIEPIIWNHIGSNHTEDSINRFSNTNEGEIEKGSRLFKLSSKKPSNTLRAGTASDRGAYTAPRPIHYSNPRCITVREAARLHGFPDWFVFHRTVWHGFREIGNAVAPLFAKRLGDILINCLDIDATRLECRSLQKVDNSILSFNMSKASKFWNVPDDVIPKRKRLLA